MFFMENKLPVGWLEVTLGDICSHPQYGWTSKSSMTGTVRYLRTSDISKGSINWDEVPFCTDLPVNDSELAKFELKENDIVVSRAGSIGLSYIVDELPFKSIFASYLIRFKPILVLPKYVYYFLQTPQYWQQISDVAAGVAVQNVNATKLADMKLPLAPLAEQIRIVAALDEYMASFQTS